MQSRGPRNHEKSNLLSASENESVFAVVGRGCLSLSTAVVQLYLAEASNRQRWNKRCCGVVCFVKDNPNRSYFIRVFDAKKKTMLWEQELYNQFKYKTPREYFHTFEAHDCQVGLNFASENEAAHFKKIVENKLMERARKKLEKKKGQTGGGGMPANNASHPTGTIAVGSGPPPAQANVSISKSAPNMASKEQPKKKGKDKGKKKLTKEDISTPTDFRHVSHVGWDPNTGLDMQKLDPEMKAMFEQLGIEQSTVDEETIDFIYDFVEKHGGLNAVKEDLARRGPPPAPPSSAPPPVHSRQAAPPPGLPSSGHPPPPPARSAAAPPPNVPPHSRGPPSLPPQNRPGMSVRPPPPPNKGSHGGPPPMRAPVSAPPPPPSRDGGHGYPPPPPMAPSGPPAPPPPPPPAAPVAPPPPPMGMPGPPAPPAPSGVRAGLLDAIHKGTTLKHVDPSSGGGSSGGGGGGGDARGNLLDAIKKGTTLKKVDDDDKPAAAPAASGGIVGALALALAQRKNVMQDSDDDDEGSDDIDDDEDEWDD